MHLKNDTRFPYVLQCERIKIVEEALKMAKAHPGIDVTASSTDSSHSRRMPTASTAQFINAAGEKETIAGRYLVSGEGARSIVRKDLGIEFEGFTYDDLTLNIEVAYDFRQHGYARAQLHFRPERNGRTCSTGRGRPTAGACISRPIRRRTRRR